jgi:hypothetical protein
MVVNGIFAIATFASQVRSAGKLARAAPKAAAAVTTTAILLEGVLIRSMAR